MNKYNKYKFILTFCIVVGILAIIRHAFELQMPLSTYKTEIIKTNVSVQDTTTLCYNTKTTIEEENAENNETTTLEGLGVSNKDSVHLFLPEIYSPITYLHSYSACFPDINPVQLKAAIAMGIEPVASREEAKKYLENHELVNITNSPFYVVDPLTHSIPYLVPECQDLLNTICVNFIDNFHAN